MNYYPFHIGDYASATRHLSWDEDAAYRRLLDVYYSREEPLPLDERKVLRLVLATTEEQREAVRTVLDEFFIKTEAGYINHRADAEIAAMRELSAKQREKANKRWKKKPTSPTSDNGPAKPDDEPGNADALPRHTENNATASFYDADAMPPTPTPTPTPTPNINNPPNPPGGDGTGKDVKVKFKPETLDLPPCVPRDLWLLFCRHRKEINKSLTETACKLLFTKLEQFHKAGHDVPDLISDAIANGWQSVHEPKGKPAFVAPTVSRQARRVYQ